MKTILLEHHPRLGYVASNRLRSLPVELPLLHECSHMVSFRMHPSRAPDTIIKKLHAAQRPLSLFGDGSYCFYGVQGDSPLAPLLLWDAAHFLRVGETITLIEDTPVESYLDREYYSGSLETIARDAVSVTYRKVAKLLAEADDDLDGWTFGIPVGPEDATVLNAVVQRILEIDLPHKEILLCGTPGSNFAYFNKVRIVGEDIPAPPIQICKKKNRLAQEARYSNLVILHDRVFLPRHFGDMIRRFGPRYPLMTLQSMFFDNRVSLHPRRYSDFCTAMGEIAQGLQGLHRSNGRSVTIAPAIFPDIEKTGLPYGNPMRYSKDMMYPTGSLYICRKAVWNAWPLDEALYWSELEDVEHGIRASRAGIPSRINPYGITQSITSRAALGGDVWVECIKGGFKKNGPVNLSILNKKPLLRISAELALAKLRQFEKKYAFAPSKLITPTGLKNLGARQWVGMVNAVVQRTTFQNDIEAVRVFISDLERLVLFDQMPAFTKEALIERFHSDPVHTKQTLITESDEIRNMLCQRVSQTWFAKGPEDFFHHDRLALPGILISAIGLYRDKHQLFYFESFTAAMKAIYNSTPFKRYAKGVR
ncbi:hypothetical protein IFR09_23740 [Pseudomonas syringae]|nr:hypothetical protein [Pseudomonas syringae]MBD8577442.1 hypothetical protein [Pseudomonas syringae]MBD8792843.1 hypothetical protein [Pseudomonas syringae]MBD8803536.1 hypothetical protein [Pseudomonas syringae]MBD8814175.1 hypothetical protein [Pseudomonas syringae]